MLTILQSINLSAEYLDKKGVEDSRRNAELLLCKVMNCKKLDLYLNFERPLSEDELNHYRILLKRRGEREPIQYITGNVEFYGLTFNVNPSVLIPRPETELLVEKVIGDFKNKRVSMLDIGTGSGNIAVSLSFHLPEAEITAVDISETALITASGNSSLHGCSDRTRFMCTDIMDKKSELFSRKYDVIVSNPPYISEKEFPLLEPELKLYEPKVALSDFSDGLSFYRRIIILSDIILNPGGKIYLEIGQGQSGHVRELLVQKSYSDISILKDYQGIDRVISGIKS